MAFGLFLAYGPAAPAQVETAGELFVELNAADYVPGEAYWTNNGTIGDFVVAPDGSVPVQEPINGATALTFGSNYTFQSIEFAPPGLIGIDPTRSIEAWVFNPDIVGEETVLSWSRRGGPCGTNMAFNYGTDVYFGAVGHWCHLPGPDIGWAPPPMAGQWHHLAYTYDGTTTRVYADGVLNNTEFLGAGVINTATGKINVAVQMEANQVDFTWGLQGTLSIGRLRIHDEVLTPEQIAFNYDLEAPEFPPIPILPEFLGTPLDDGAIRGYPYVASFRATGYPIPEIQVIEPAGATITSMGSYMNLKYDVPAGAPASFQVTLRAENVGGQVDASWTVTVKDPPLPGQLESSGELFVDLDAGDDTAGTLEWTNNGTMGNFTEVGDPQVTEIDGAKAVTFNTLPDVLDVYQSINDAAPGLVGLDPTRSIEVWAYNPHLVQEETILAWGQRGGPGGTNMSFNFGYNEIWGAAGQWDTPDIGWLRSIPSAGRWHHLAYTYDGTATRVFVDGAQANFEYLGSGIINTYDFNKITLTAQNPIPLPTAAEFGLRGTLSIGRVRIHDEVLKPYQVLNNYLAEKGDFPVPAVTPQKLPQAPAHRYSFTSDATDSIAGAHGITYGDVTFENGQAVLNNQGTELSNATGVSPPADPPGAYIDLPNGIVSGLGDQATFETWVTWGGPDISMWQRIFDFGRSATGEDASDGAATNGYVCLTPRSGEVTLRTAYRSPASPYEERQLNGNVLEVGKQVHIVVTWDGAQGKTGMYVNGARVDEFDTQFALSDLPDLNNWLGRSQYADPMFKGSYNEVRLYGYALTPGQILGSFNAGPDTLDVIPPRAEVVRDLLADGYTSGDVIDVLLSVTMKEGETSISIQELLPPGAAVSDISDGGTYAGGSISWNLTGITQKTLTYKLIPYPCGTGFKYGSSSWIAGGSSGKVGGEFQLDMDLSDKDLGQWESLDIGTSGGAAQALAPRDLLVNATGVGSKLAKDELRFVHVPQSGDWEISARIDCVDFSTEPNVTGMGGLMVRDTLDTFSAHAYFFISSTPPAAGGIGTLRGLYRRETNSATPRNIAPITISNKDVTSLPVYLKIRRAANQIIFERSDDGSAYAQVATPKNIGTGTSDLNIKNDVLIGLASASGGTGLARYIYRDVNGVPQLPEFSVVSGPNPPTNLQAAAATGRIDLSWDAPASGPAPTGYVIFRDGSRLGEVGATPRTYSDTGLPADTRHCYKVKTKSGADESVGFSNEACATTPGAGGGFKRGDANADGAVDLSDPVNVLGFLFLGNPATLNCKDAADSDDSGELDITDAVYSLNWQFLGGKDIPAPGPFTCGEDLTADPFPACDYPPAKCQ